MDRKQAVKLGFLSRCIDEGLELDEIRARIRETHARLKSAGVGGSVVSALTGGGKKLLGLAAGTGWPAIKGVALAGPPVLGLIGGAALGRAVSDDIDPEEAKKQELLAEYHRAIARAKSRQLV